MTPIREELEAALQAIEREAAAIQAGNEAGLKAERAALAVHGANLRRLVADPDPGAAPEEDPLNEEVLRAALADEDPAAVLRAALAPPPVVVSASAFAGAPLPAPVLWRHAPDDPDGPLRHRDTVLCVGEVAILSGAGSLGKSSTVWAVVSAAALAGEDGALYGAACGLAVAAGPVVVVNYEDAPARVAQGLQAVAGEVPVDVHLAPNPSPLWVGTPDAPGASGPGALWAPLWAAVRTIGARLVVIDPVSVAFAGASTTETGPVRAFLSALTAEAAAAGAGVLLVAHDTKAARNAVAAGDQPGAGVVSGSAAWYDGARGVLALAHDPVMTDARLLECVKSNYGRAWWGARLVERTGAAGDFRGLVLDRNLTRSELADAKPKPKPKAKAKATDTAGIV